jgi:hypothetical protein
MFEFHGWIVIRIVGWDDYNKRLEEAFLFALRAVGEAQDGYSHFSATQNGNGLYMVQMHGLRNHRRDNAMILFNKIADALPACYGVLYLYDPEDSENDVGFRIFRMAQGRVDEFEDKILSPRFPIIDQDEY